MFMTKCLWTLCHVKCLTRAKLFLSQNIKVLLYLFLMKEWVLVVVKFAMTFSELFIFIWTWRNTYGNRIDSMFLFINVRFFIILAKTESICNQERKKINLTTNLKFEQPLIVHKSKPQSNILTNWSKPHPTNLYEFSWNPIGFD